MSQGLEQIENYFQGRMTAVEAKEFEKSIESDPDFAKEVAFYISAAGVVKDQLNVGKKIRFRQIYDSSKMMVADQLAPSQGKGVVIRKIWKYAVAAAVFSAVLVSTYFYTAGPSPQQMADQFVAKEFKVLGVHMGTTSDGLNLGKQYNDAGQYSQALQIFKNIANQYPDNVKAREYAGIVALQMKDYNTALQYFKSLSSIQGLNSNPGNFYTALALMKRNEPGDTDQAKEILAGVVRNKETYSEVAETWLRNW